MHIYFIVTRADTHTHTYAHTHTDDTDYTPVTAVLVLDNALRSDCFQVRILDDDLFEDPVREDFSINISNVESTNSDFRVVTSPTNVTVVIADDDRSVTIGFSDVFYSVNESDNVRVCVVVTIPPPMERFTQQDIVLRVSTVPGTASKCDYRDVCYSLEVTIIRSIDSVALPYFMFQQRSIFFLLTHNLVCTYM